MFILRLIPGLGSSLGLGSKLCRREVFVSPVGRTGGDLLVWFIFFSCFEMERFGAGEAAGLEAAGGGCLDGGIRR